MTEYRAVIDRGFLAPTKYLRVTDFEKDSKAGLTRFEKTSGETVYYPPRKIKRIEQRGDTAE